MSLPIEGMELVSGLKPSPFPDHVRGLATFLEKMSVVIDSLFFRGIEALALLLNSLLFPFLRGSSGPGLSMLGLGSLGRKIQMSVSGARSLESLFCLFEFKSSRITRAFPCTAELFLVSILLWLEEQSERCICRFSSSVP